MKKKLGIIGHFGGGKNYCDGQTVKTRVLYEELTKRGLEDILCVDTHVGKTNKIKLFSEIMKCMKACEKVIIMLSHQELKAQLSTVCLGKKLFKATVYHDAVYNGAYDDKTARSLQLLDANWVENEYIKGELEKSGITNCEVFPDFRANNPRNALREPSERGRYRLCMFGTVAEEKGVTDAIEAVVSYNGSHEMKIHLDIWGQVREDYAKKFQRLIHENSGHITYMGKADFHKSTEALTDHLALLFPSKNISEGVPGAIIDAYGAGVPVITSAWRGVEETVKNFQTGIIYPNDKADTLSEAIAYAVDHYDELCAMRRNCTLMSTRYSPNYVMPRITDKYLKG